MYKFVAFGETNPIRKSHPSTALTHAPLMCISKEKAIIRAATAFGRAASTVSGAASTSPSARQSALRAVYKATSAGGWLVVDRPSLFSGGAVALG